MSFPSIFRPVTAALLASAFVSVLPAAKPAAPRIARWESTIKNFEARDAQTPPPRGAVLLIGGSNARRWTNVDKSFPKHHVINRGFGGARMTEILHFADRIVLPYEPKVILVNAGGNDLNAGSSPAQVRKTAAALVAKMRTKLPDTQIYFIGLPFVRRAFAHPEGRALIRSFNSEITSLAKQEPKVGFIDLVPAFLGDEDKFRADLFVQDGTHFSPKGYELVAGLLRDKL